MKMIKLEAEVSEPFRVVFLFGLENMIIYSLFREELEVLKYRGLLYHKIVKILMC